MGNYALVFRRLEKVGLVLLTDVDWPSVAGLVAGKPVRGSWWGHARGKEIFEVSEKLADHPDVTSVKLVKNKVTFVHRRLRSVFPARIGSLDGSPGLRCPFSNGWSAKGLFGATL